MTTVAIWHRADLRTGDNAALAAATRALDAGDAEAVAPLFVFDPQYYSETGLASDARLRFLHESLRDLRRQYETLDSTLALVRGDPRDRLRRLLESGTVDSVVFNRHPTSRYGKAVADEVRSWPETTSFADDGLRYAARRHRDGTPKTDTREGWREACEAYFEREPVPRPDSLGSNPIGSETSIPEIERGFDVSPDKRRVQEGGTVAANARLSSFLDEIRDYPGNISPPAAAEEHSSRLSPHLAFGTLSPRQVYHRVHEEATASRGREMLVSRLFWNRHYHQKLADWPGWTDRAVNPVFRDLFRSNHDPDLAAAWRAGQTGVPMVDAAMRALVETGYLNFRMRAMVATFYVYILKEWWKPGADFMYRQLVDADAAINYTQWQSQCNLTGVHPVRVYDPAKQLREYDPDGEFVREFVPELAPLPDEHLAEPHRAPEHVQAETGVDIGTDYPLPVVDYDHEADRARTLWSDLADRAREAIREGSRTWRRASLSRRREFETDSEETGQTSLDDF